MQLDRNRGRRIPPRTLRGGAVDPRFVVKLNKQGLSFLELTLVANYIDRIEADVQKLREAVMDGRYDPRSDVGDAVLRMEGQLRQIRESIPTVESIRQKQKTK